MLAFVLSGGGNFGAMQAGALNVLLKAGIKPQMIVGTSAGALNAIYIGSNPTVEGAEYLENLWIQAKPTEMGLTALFDVVGNFKHLKESLFSNKTLLKYLKKNLPPNIKTFGDLKNLTGISVYTTAVEIPTKRLRVFGDNPSDSLIDGGLSSTALPPYYPPWQVDNYHYIDGGALANLPIKVAIKRGADEIVALHITNIVSGEGEGMLETIAFAISVMTKQQTNYQLKLAKALGVKVHYISLIPEKIRFWDFSQAQKLILAGRQEMERYLSNPHVRIPSGPSLRYLAKRIFFMPRLK